MRIAVGRYVVSQAPSDNNNVASAIEHRYDDHARALLFGVSHTVASFRSLPEMLPCIHEQ